MNNVRKEKVIIGIIAIGYVLWAATLIYKSSFVAIDGKRYYCLFDDAMISMRYAWNFSHGLGLVWNPGEFVQGYTNLLMTLLMSLATLIFNKSIAALFIQIVGGILMLLNAYLSMLITNHLIQSKHHQHKGLIKIVIFFCVLFYYPLNYWALMGMETSLLTLFLLLGVLSSLNYANKKTPAQLFWTSGYLGLAYLTRNDSIIFAFLIFLFIIWETYILEKSQKPFLELLGAIILYIVFVVGQGVFQFLYYGDLLPNTYTLKLSGMPLLARIKNGIGFITPFLNETAIILCVSIIGLILDFRKKKLLLLSIAIAAIAYQIYVGGDPWTYWRIMSPAMPLLLIVFIQATLYAIEAISNTSIFRTCFLRNQIFPKRYVAEVFCILLSLTGLFFANARFFSEISLLIKPYKVEDNQRNVNTAIALNELTTSDATVGVFWAGSIPYYTDKVAIDFLGKSDRHIAALPSDSSVRWSGMNGVPGHDKYDLNYSIKLLSPTYVQGFVWGAQDLTSWAETKYIEIDYYGVSLFLLKESPSVLWKIIDFP